MSKPMRMAKPATLPLAPALASALSSALSPALASALSSALSLALALALALAPVAAMPAASHAAQQTAAQTTGPQAPEQRSGIMLSGLDPNAQLEKQRPGGCKATALSYALNILTGSSRYSQTTYGGARGYPCADIGGQTFMGADGVVYVATYFRDDESCGKQALLEKIAESLKAGLPIVASVHKTGVGSKHHWVAVVGEDGGEYLILDPYTGAMENMSDAGYDWGLADVRTYGYIGFGRLGGGVKLSDGDFVMAKSGAAYRMAGGAPMLVSDWSSFGGAQACTSIPDGQLEMLLQARPVPGTSLIDAKTGRLYRVIEDGRIYHDSGHSADGASAPPQAVAIDDWELRNQARLNLDPAGAVDRIVRGEGSIKAIGWAFDDDANNSQLIMHVYIGDSLAGIGRADIFRPDIEKTYPGVGERHGFSITIKTDKTGRQRVRVVAVNAPGTAGSNATLLDTFITIRPAQPTG